MLIKSLIFRYLDEKCRIWVYKLFISSNFNYRPVFWEFCGKTNLKKMEKLYERVLRFVFHNAASSCETLLERGNFLSLSVYKMRCLAIEVFKCVHGNNPAYMNNLFQQSNLKHGLLSPQGSTCQYAWVSNDMDSLWHATKYSTEPLAMDADVSYLVNSPSVNNLAL